MYNQDVSSLSLNISLIPYPQNNFVNYSLSFKMFGRLSLIQGPTCTVNTLLSPPPFLEEES